MSVPTLYVVATPIGNLRDITLRALETLAAADVIACEDTRVSRKLLDHYGITAPLTPYHEHNAAAARPKLLARLTASEAVALVSDAGTPLVSDPGFKLAREAREAGHAVSGLFMQNWNDDGSGDCRAEDDRRDAVAVCGRLGIPFHARNFADRYWTDVFEHFLHEYAAGRTPNPDVLCNREIKFKTFLDEALALGADRIATGHYARVDERDGRFRLLRGREVRSRNLPVASIREVPPGWQVEESALVSGSCVISLDYFKRFVAGLRLLFGGRIASYETLLDRARREAILRMKEQAHEAGYRAVIGVRLETSQVAQATRQGGTAGVEVLAWGTALRLGRS